MSGDKKSDRENLDKVISYLKENKIGKIKNVFYNFVGFSIQISSEDLTKLRKLPEVDFIERNMRQNQDLEKGYEKNNGSLNKANDNLKESPINVLSGMPSPYLYNLDRINQRNYPLGTVCKIERFRSFHARMVC
jgi:hypothetical protein